MYNLRCWLGILFINFLVLLLSVGVYADAKKQYQEANEDEKKIESYLALAQQYSTEKNFTAKDSINNLAIMLAELNGNDKLLMKAYEVYFAVTDFSTANNTFLSTPGAKEHAQHVLAIAENNNNNQWKYFAYTAQARTHLLTLEYKEAIDKIEQANYYVHLISNDSLKIQNYIIWGKCLEANNNKLDAFRNYLNGFYLAQKTHDKRQLSLSYEALSHFYLLIENYSSARSYKLKQIGLKLEKDSLSLMYNYSDLARILYYCNEHIKADKLTQQIILYAKQNGFRDLLNVAFSRHRTYLVEKGKLTELAELYTHAYPEELTRLHKEDTATYYRTMALISEVQGDMDAAQNFYEKVEDQYAGKSISIILLSNIYRRYGQFLWRIGKKERAIEKLRDAFAYAEEVNYLPYLVETTAMLDSLYQEKNDIENAYLFSKKNKEFSTLQSEVVKQDEILQMEVNNEARQRKLRNEQEQEETERRHNLQYMAIIILMITIFIILIMLGSFKVPTWVIKSLGFFAFIFLFEFVILLLDHKIMEITHHEPWKMLALKVILISFLLPLHHWVEHKVVHYLLEKKLIKVSNLSFINRFKKKKVIAVVEEDLPS